MDSRTPFQLPLFGAELFSIAVNYVALVPRVRSHRLKSSDVVISFRFFVFFFSLDNPLSNGAKQNVSLQYRTPKKENEQQERQAEINKKIRNSGVVVLRLV